MRAALLLAASLITLTACSSTVQTTSGADYLRRASVASPATAVRASLDAQVREIASVGPQLFFPARIGLARIENGVLTTPPAEEAQLWAELQEQLGATAGEFVPVSPLIVAMVRPADAQNEKAALLVADIRRGAARQHLDYVLIYEIASIDQTREMH
jgi:hypothetical protein